MATESLRMSAVIPAEPERVYRSWLDSRDHGTFTGGQATIEPWVGGRHSAWDGYIEGTFLELESGRRIVQTWRTTEFPPESVDSQVVVTLEPAEGGTLVTIVHTEIPEGQGEKYEQGWMDFYFKPMRDYFGRETASSESDAREEDGAEVAARKKNMKTTKPASSGVKSTPAAAEAKPAAKAKPAPAKTKPAAAKTKPAAAKAKPAPAKAKSASVAKAKPARRAKRAKAKAAARKKAKPAKAARRAKPKAARAGKKAARRKAAPRRKASAKKAKSVRRAKPAVSRGRKKAARSRRAAPKKAARRSAKSARGGARKRR